MKGYLGKYAGFALAVALMSFGGFIQAQSRALGDPKVPDVNFNAKTQGDTPFGAFKITQCDGPEGLNRIDPSAKKGEPTNPAYRLDKDPAQKQYFIEQFGHEPPFVPCDFRGAVIQIQYLINAMIMVGVLAALIGFSYAGFLYITGVEKNISKAHAIFPKIFWGFIIMLTAWFMVYQILRWLTPPDAGYLQ